MYKELQNGSDIRGVAITTEKGEATLTKRTVTAIGAGFAKFISERLNKKPLKIAIGYDSRISAKDMQRFIANGISAYLPECTIADSNLSSTPAMFMSTVMENHLYDAAVMITASHLPFERNGFKFFTKDGSLEKQDIKAILQFAEELDGVYDGTQDCELLSVDIMSDYCKFLQGVIIKKANLGDKPLSGLHIITDAGNGAGGFFAEKVLQPLGANISGSVNSVPDGTFPVHAPNPEDSKAAEYFSKVVSLNPCDLGLMFDTDVDRSAAMLSDGTAINRNRLIALMTAIVLTEHKSPIIVTDSVTSTGLAEFITSKGAVHKRFKRGYRNVINEAQRLCGDGHDACLAIETSGHGALRENYFMDDGAYMAALITAQAAICKKNGTTVASLISDLKEPAEALELRLKITVPDFKEYGQRVIDKLSDYVTTSDGYSIAPDNYEGIRVNADKNHGDGWFLLRLSLHDPVLPLNLESNSVGGVKIMRDYLDKFLTYFPELEY